MAKKLGRSTGFSIPGKRLAAKGVPVGPHHSGEVQRSFLPVAETVFEGIEMGVLGDGTPYLTMRGLAKVCGVDFKAIHRLASNWEEERRKPRGAWIDRLLKKRGYREDSLYIRFVLKGVETFAFPDRVCLVILEYYGFEAKLETSEIATENFRNLAGDSIRRFIFDHCGFDPDRHIPDSWRNFHQRVLLNLQLPIGYYSVFAVLAEVVVSMIRAGCPFDSHTVPDISVGQLWSKHWEEMGYDGVYGPRVRHPHIYPDWFPQAAAGPVPAWIYPMDSCSAFHHWIQAVYIPKAFPKYIKSKVDKGVFLPARGEQLVAALSARANNPRLS